MLRLSIPSFSPSSELDQTGSRFLRRYVMDLLCSVAYGLLLENAGNISTIQLFTIKYLFVDMAQKCWKNFCNRVFIIKYLLICSYGIRAYNKNEKIITKLVTVIKWPTYSQWKKEVGIKCYQ